MGLPPHRANRKFNKIEKASPDIKTLHGMDMKSTRTLSKMIKVEAWAKHLLEQIEKLIKLKKRARTSKTLHGMMCSEFGQTTELSMVVPSLSTGSSAAAASASARIYGIIWGMKVGMWVPSHLLAGDVLLKGAVPHAISDSRHFQHFLIQCPFESRRSLFWWS